MFLLLVESGNPGSFTGDMSISVPCFRDMACGLTDLKQGQEWKWQGEERERQSYRYPMTGQAGDGKEGNAEVKSQTHEQSSSLNGLMDKLFSRCPGTCLTRSHGKGKPTLQSITEAERSYLVWLLWISDLGGYIIVCIWSWPVPVTSLLSTIRITQLRLLIPSVRQIFLHAFSHSFSQLPYEEDIISIFQVRKL